MVYYPIQALVNPGIEELLILATGDMEKSLFRSCFAGSRGDDVLSALKALPGRCPGLVSSAPLARQSG